MNKALSRKKNQLFLKFQIVLIALMFNSFPASADAPTWDDGDDVNDEYQQPAAPINDAVPFAMVAAIFLGACYYIRENRNRKPS